MTGNPLDDAPYSAPQVYGWKEEVRYLSSKYPNGALMYPGPRVVTWVAIFPGVFCCAGISEEAA